MSLSMKRNWYLIVIAILFLWILCYFGSKRVISINIGEKWNVTTWLFDIDNTIDLFDSTQVHEINILMSAEKYQSMIDSYSETSEKERFKTDIIIDWITVNDVWVRLKWNSTLRWWGWKWWMMNDGWWMMKKFKNGEWMPDLPRMDWDWPNEFDMPQDFWSWKFPDFSFDLNSQNLPLLIKFDKFVNQTYQWHEMLSIRLWGGMWRSQSSWQTFLEEPYSYELYQEMWLPSPDTSYWVVSIAWKTWVLYELSELPEDSYFIQKWFGDDNWVLYKAWNFVNFEYISEDPLDYTDSFTQKTRVNDYDLALLIKLLKFVTQSSDEEFEEKINDYIDVESVLTLLAIDNFVWNNDSFGWMWSNYYLYYHLWEQKFYMLTWDQNLALGGMWWMWIWINNEKITMNNDEQNNFSWSEKWFLKEISLWTESEEYKSGDIKIQNENNFKHNFKWDFNWDFWWKNWWFGRNANNLLKTRLLAIEKYSKMHDEILENVKNIALNTQFSDNFFDTWTTALLKYNESNHIIDESIYLDNVENIKLRLK